MEPIQLQLVGNRKTVEKVGIGPVLGLRLLVFAKINKLSLGEMISLALRFTVAPDGKSPDLKCAEEDEIVAIAAKMLVKTSRAGVRK